MPSAFSSILRDHRIRVPTLTLVALAFTYASTMPYQSIIGINELGLSDRTYSGLIFLAALVNVTTSLTLGIWSDKLSDRRPLVLALSVCGMLGFGMIYAFRTAGVFIFATLVLIPMSNSTYSILFASIRATTNTMDRGRGAAITSTVRALFSGSWALAPGMIGLYLIHSQSMTPAYGIAGLASLTCFCFYLFLARPAPKREGPPAQQIGFLSSLGRILSPHVLARIGVMALLLGLQRSNSVVSPLIITHAAGGSVVDVGFMAGLVAFLEMPFMMMWGALQRRFRTVHVLAVGTLIYCLYLVLLGFASAPWHVYALERLWRRGDPQRSHHLHAGPDRRSAGARKFTDFRQHLRRQRHQRLDLRSRHQFYQLFRHRTDRRRHRPCVRGPAAFPRKDPASGPAADLRKPRPSPGMP